MVIKPTVCYVYAIWPKHQIPVSSVENVNRTDKLTYMHKTVLFPSFSINILADFSFFSLLSAKSQQC